MGVEPRRPSQALALAAAVAVHAAFLAALVWRLGATPVYPPTPVINVELTPLRLDRPERPRAPPPSRPERSLPRLHIPPPSPLPPPLSPVAPAPGPDGQELGMQRTLRGALGCRPEALARLTPEERRGCEDRMAAVRPGAQAVRLDLDPRGRFGREPEPYLARRPKSGCKVRAAGDADPMGKQGPAAGVSCAWAF